RGRSRFLSGRHHPARRRRALPCRFFIGFRSAEFGKLARHNGFCDLPLFRFQQLKPRFPSLLGKGETGFLNECAGAGCLNSLGEGHTDVTLLRHGHSPFPGVTGPPAPSEIRRSLAVPAPTFPATRPRRAASVPARRTPRAGGGPQETGGGIPPAPHSNRGSPRSRYAGAAIAGRIEQPFPVHSAPGTLTRCAARRSIPPPGFPGGPAGYRNPPRSTRSTGRPLRATALESAVPVVRQSPGIPLPGPSGRPVS